MSVTKRIDRLEKALGDFREPFLGLVLFRTPGDDGELRRIERGDEKWWREAGEEHRAFIDRVWRDLKSNRPELAAGPGLVRVYGYCDHTEAPNATVR